MQVKTAGEDLKRLIKAANDEHVENLRRAFENGRAASLEDMQRYKNAAFLALVRGASDLIDLVTESQ